MLLSAAAFASDDSVVNDPLNFKDAKIPKFDSISASEIYERTQAVLQHFGVPAEASNADLVSLYDRGQTASDLTRILRVLDSSNQFARFVRQQNGELQVFLDRDDRNEEDFALSLSTDATPSVYSTAVENLRRARANSSAQPLLGLRVALDPGHMGTPEWDARTGKFVHDKQGNKVSEGMINLQTCLVLKAELEKLGATVALTRNGNGTVSTVPYQQLDLQAYGKLTLREKSLEAWFQALLAANDVGPALYNSFASNAKFQALFKESARANYYILREDLEARVQFFEKFRPDISLVIHYDSQDPANDPNGINSRRYSRVKTYVHGSISPEEWAQNGDRRFFYQHALDSGSWDASFSLSQSVVSALSKGLGLATDNGGGGSSVQVAPGVFSRNLYITKKAHGHAHTYVECLHYNDPGEFQALRQKDFSLVIDGQTTWYSKRLQQVAFSIRDGVVSFVRGQGAAARGPIARY